MSKVVLITGGSSGIGLHAAAALVNRGCKVYELSRREHSAPGIIHIKADVSNEAEVLNAVDMILNSGDTIDVLINNAGFGISGAVEFTSNENAQRLLDVNFFGMVNTVKAVIPVMRENHGGKIINISSVAAVLPIPFQVYYSVSKAAINSFSMAVANEVAPFGIQVCAVMPGDIKTGFTAARKKTADGEDIYCGRISRSITVMEHDEQNGMAPEEAGSFISKVALKKHVKPFYTIGIKYKLFVILSKLLPPAFVNKIIYSIYAK